MHWGPFLRRSQTLNFWHGVGVSRLLHMRTQNHCPTAARCYHCIDVSSRQMWAISHQLDVTVTFLSNCSRRGGRGRPVTNAQSRFSSVSGMRGSDWRLTGHDTYMEKRYWGELGGGMSFSWLKWGRRSASTGERRKSVVEIRCGMSRTSPFFRTGKGPF